MSDQKSSQAGHIGRRGPALVSLAAVVLAGCAAAPAAAPPAAVAAESPVLQAVATGALNAPQAVAGGQLVTVLSDYISGEGDECRGYSLGGQGAPPVARLACRDGGTWRDIAPLAPQANPGVLP